MGNLGLKMLFVAERAIKILALMNASPSLSNSKLFASVLAQRSSEELTDYFLFRAYTSLLASGKIDVIDKNELYVVFDSEEGEGKGVTGYSCLFGSTILNPPLQVIKSNEFREMWEYMQRVTISYASCDFQSFVEKRIEEVWKSLVRYEKMLVQDIVPIEYVLASPQGAEIQSALFAETKEKIKALVECRRILERTSAPVFILQENAMFYASSMNILKALRKVTPRNTVW